MLSPAAYHGYFDESGKFNDSTVVAIAGYVSSPLKWNRFSNEWRRTLDNYGISNFHAADCEHGVGEFKKLDKEKRTELLIRLIPIINKHIVFGVGFGYFVEDFKAVTIGRTQNSHPMIKDPWYGCFFMCVYSLLLEQMKKRTNSQDKVALVYHQNNEMQGRAQLYFAEHQKDNVDEGRITSLTFADDKDYLPLQASDLLVYETYKECHNQRYDPQRKVRKSFDALRSTNKILGGYADINALQHQVDIMKANNAF